MGSLKKNSLIDKTIDFIFSNHELKWLILIFILGLVLRFFVASNVPIVADEPVHGMHAIGVASLQPLSTLSQSPLWFYITDIAYNLFGITLFSARFLSFFFGALSVPVIYLIARQLFNVRAALIAAFLLATSIYHIVWAAVYMDEGMMFFVLLAMYLFLKEYRDKKTISLWSAVALGIALLMKIIAAVFIVVFGFFILGILYNNYRKDKKLFRLNFKRAIIFGIIIFVCFLPPLAYNYFLYTKKGIVDLPFALYFGINREYYQGAGLAHEKGFDINQLGRSFLTMLRAFRIFDPLFSLLALFGFLFLYPEYKKNKFQQGFIISMFIFSVIIIDLSVELPNHYTNFLPFLALFGGFFVEKISHRATTESNKKRIILIICLILLLFSLYIMWDGLTSKSAYDKIRRYAISSIGSDELVVVDSRIYRGVIAWTFNDKHYIESGSFAELVNISENLPGEKVPVKVKFVECVIDDCGWGTVHENQYLNKSTEELVTLFAGLSKDKVTLLGGGSVRPVKGNEIKGQPMFRIYSTSLALKPGIVRIADQTHNFFFYPVRRNLNPRESFDYYETRGSFEIILSSVSYIILYLLLVAALLSPLFLIYILYKTRNNFI